MIKFKLIVSGLALSGVIAACNQSANNGNILNQDSTANTVSVSPEIKDGDTKQVYKHYIYLKDVLVESNASEAQTVAKELALALIKIEGCENTAALATKIVNTSDIKEQRFNFTALSSDIIALVKHTEITSGSMYVQYCPMANEGKGGYWLASETEIRNPYYGNEMLNCGEVKDTIEKK